MVPRSRWSLPGRLAVAAITVIAPLQGLGLAETTAAHPDARPPVQLARSSSSDWPRQVLAGGQPGAHILWDVAMRSPGDGLAVGLGGGDLSARARRWDGVAWRPTQPVGGSLSELLGVDSLHSGIAWAVGDIGTAALAERWDGHGWMRFPTPKPAPETRDILMDVAAVAADDVWAVGYTLELEGNDVSPMIEHFDGKRWKRVDSPAPPDGADAFLSGVDAIGPSDVWAVGGGPQATMLEHWNGHAWELVDRIRGAHGRHVEPYSISAISTDDVWVVGDYIGGTDPLSLHWDGHSWTAVEARAGRQPLTLLYDVAAITADDVWAVGCTSPYGVRCGHTLAEHWDGAAWRRVHAPKSGTNTGLYGVSANTADDIWAVGYYSTDTEQTFRQYYLHWDGSQWERVRARNSATTFLPRSPMQTHQPRRHHLTVRPIAETVAAAPAAGWPSRSGRET